MPTYRQELWWRSRAETQYLQPWRAYASIASAILSPLMNRYMGATHVSLSSVILASIMAGLGVYVLLAVGEVIVRYMVTVPAEIWSENRTTIERLERDLREIRDSAWPSSFKAMTRQAIIEALAGTFASFAVYHNPPSNCGDFALALNDVLASAGWMSRQLRPVESGSRLPAGIRIAGGAQAVNALAHALKTILDIDAHTAIAEVNGSVEICVGDRRAQT